MPKTDKELTVEVVNEIIRAWGVSEKAQPIQPSQVPQIIEDVYHTIQSLYGSPSL